MSSPGSESSWCMVDPREHRQQMEAAVDKQAMLYQQAQMASSAANLSHVRRLGTARTHVAMDDPDPMPPLIATVPISAPAPTPGAIPFGSKKHAPRDFPRTEEKVEREPPKGQSFTRKLKTSLLGGKNPFLASNKAHEKEKDRKEAIVIPPPLSPEPDAVVVRHPGSESNGSTPELVAPAPTSSSRGARPPPVTYSRDLYSVQPPQHQPQRRRGSSAAPPEPTNEPPKSEISLRRSREVLIVEVAGKRAGDVSIEREPVLGALQTHRRSPGKAMFAQPTQHAQPGQPTHPVQHAHPVQPTHPTQPTRSTHQTQPAQSAPAPASAHAPAPGASPSTIRPLPPAPAPVQSTPPRPLPAPGPSRVVVRPVAPLTRPSQESLHPGAHYRDSQSSQQTSSSPPVVRYKTSMDRTSYATSTTTPSLGSSVKTHASQAVSDPPRKDPPNRDTPSKALPNRDPPTRSPPSKDPPSNDPPSKDMERIQWAAAPPSRPPNPDPAPVVVREQPDEAGAWSESMAQLTLRANKQPGYHMEMASKYEKPQETTPPPTQEPKAKPRKLQRHPTTAATTATTYYYYDSSPPLITRVSRLSELKEDYRNPGSERSNIIRRKINYLRFELGFTGLRRARGDGNCFYRSFAFSYLEQILFAEDRALAVVNALEQLEMAQNLIDVAIPGHRFSQQMHLYLRDVIRNMELGKTDQKRLLHIFQDQRDSDDIVAYVRLLASAYIRLTPETHASVFHPDDPMTVITPSDFCSIYVEQLGQDADHLQISALSRTLNVSVYIYRLDEKLDGESAPNEQDLPAHCTRFVPSELSPVTEPVFLLFRPGHYDILERHTNY